MSYERQTWYDYPTGGTPTSAGRFNWQEGGIQELSDQVDALTVDSVTGHEAAVDPHPQYLTAGEGDARYPATTDPRLADARTPTAHAPGHAPGGSDALAGYVNTSTAQAVGGVKTFTEPPVVPVGTAAEHPVRRDDARLVDARAPAAHAASHASAGSDPLTPAAIGAVPATSSGWQDLTLANGWAHVADSPSAVLKDGDGTVYWSGILVPPFGAVNAQKMAQLPPGTYPLRGLGFVMRAGNTYGVVGVQVRTDGGVYLDIGGSNMPAPTGFVWTAGTWTTK